MARASRFIKKVPPSGGPPAFKLTLPHQVVHRHLLHLIDAEFELAPTANAQQTWQGSIAPRRNKDRSEYTLQGWKLFAEAHKVKAGDQVSFELVGPHRMVVQIIRPMETTTPMHESPQCARISSKCLKLDKSSSPGGGSSDDFIVSESDFEPDWLSAAMPMLDGLGELDGGWPYIPIAAAQPSRGSERSSSQVADEHPVEVTQPDQSEGQFPSPSGPVVSDALCGGTYHSNLTNLSAATSAPPVEGSHLSTSLPAFTLSPQATSKAATPFSDLLRSPLDTASADTLPSLEAQKDALDAEDMGGSVELVQMPSAASQLNLQLGDLTTTIHTLQADVQRLEARAGGAESEFNTLRSLYKRLQSRLDQQSRGALRATSDLERATARMAMPHLLVTMEKQTAEAVLAVQAELLASLAALKKSMWELVVLSLDAPKQAALPGIGQVQH